MRRESRIYLVGVVLLGLGYETMKSALGGEWLFFAVGVGYLVLVRLVGRWTVRRWPEVGE